MSLNINSRNEYSAPFEYLEAKSVAREYLDDKIKEEYGIEITVKGCIFSGFIKPSKNRPPFEISFLINPIEDQSRDTDLGEIERRINEMLSQEESQLRLYSFKIFDDEEAYYQKSDLRLKLYLP